MIGNLNKESKYFFLYILGSNFHLKILLRFKSRFLYYESSLTTENFLLAFVKFNSPLIGTSRTQK